MSKKAWLISIVGLLTAALLIVVVATWNGGGDGPSGDAHRGGSETKEIMWKDLQQLDYKTDTAPAWLRELSGKKVKIPGFIVPLENNQKISEFLLVPNQAYCNHVPPPPPNLMIQVKMAAPIDTQSHGGPVWLTGILKIETKKSQFGDAAYQVAGTGVEDYKY